MALTIEAVSEALEGRFEIHDEIRAGGQGTVLRARRMRSPDGSETDDAVALKLYFSSVEHQRVEREVSAMERIRHPNLAGLVEHGQLTIEGQAVRYVAWEFIRGEALDERITTGAVPAVLVARTGRDVTAAISELWSRSIVHRDIKPGNIMVCQGENQTVLIDLGVARHLSEASLTAYGQTWGTRGYMSPEQARTERQLTCKSDLYSLGVVLVEALIGRHPTGYDQAALASTPPRTGVLAPLTPGGLSTLIDSLLAPRAAFRPDPSAASLEFARWAELLNK